MPITETTSGRSFRPPPFTKCLGTLRGAPRSLKISNTSLSSASRLWACLKAELNGTPDFGLAQISSESFSILAGVTGYPPDFCYLNKTFRESRSKLLPIMTEMWASASPACCFSFESVVTELPKLGGEEAGKDCGGEEKKKKKKMLHPRTIFNLYLIPTPH